MKKHKILIVDDEEDLCEILQFNLEAEGFIVDTAFSAEEALDKDIKSYNLLLFDVMMEQMSGFKLAEKVRKHLKLNTPIIFITAKNKENDLLTGFNIGADDYITKPFSINEVIVRVKAILKRVKFEENKEVENLIILDSLELDIEKLKITIDNQEIKLTKKEFEILAMLLSNQGKTFSRDEIISHVWDEFTVVTNRTIDVHVTRLRKKIGEYGKYIKSKSGYGYLFEVE